MNFDYLFKILIIGEENVGKTCFGNILRNNTYNQFHDPTIGIEISSYYHLIKDKMIKTLILDTSGKNVFLPLLKSYYKGIAGVIVMYSVDDRKSFEKVDFWLNEINKNKSDDQIQIIMVGNKIDTERVVTYEEGLKKAEKYNLVFFETSIRENKGCVNTFKKLCNDILTNYDPTIGHSGIFLQKKTEIPDDCCCCC